MQHDCFKYSRILISGQTVNGIKNKGAKAIFLLLNQYGYVDHIVNWIKIQVPKVNCLSVFYCTLIFLSI